MAEEIAYNISVNTEKAKSLKELKKDFKDAQTELSGLTVGTKAYIDQLSKLGAIRDNLGDLNAEINAFNPEGKVKAFGDVIGGLASGFQAAQGAAALFGNESEDVQKALLKVQAVMAFTEGIKGIAGLSDGFKKLGVVIKSNPLFLIIGVIVSIGGALVALKDKVSFIGDAFDYVSKIVNGTIDAFKQLTDWIGITSFASDELAAKQISNAQKAGQAISDKYDREIARAEAAGKRTVEMEIKKREAIIETLKLEAIAMTQAAMARGEYTDEEDKRFTEMIALAQKASDEIVLIQIRENKIKTDENKKTTDKISANNKKITEDEKRESQERIKASRNHLNEILAIRKGFDELERQERKEAIAKENAESDAEVAKITRNQEARRQLIINHNERTLAGHIENLRAQRDLELANTELTESEKLLIKEKYADLEDEIEDEKWSQRLQLAKTSISAMQSLSDIAFAFKMSSVKKGSKEEEAVARKQFEVNKAFNIATTAINTIMGVRNALIPNAPESPLVMALRIANATAIGLGGVAAIAKIKSTQLGGGSVGGVDMGGGGSSLPGAPTIAPPNQGNTDLNPDGTIKVNNNSQQVIKAMVVETDVTKTQKTVKQIEDKAKL
jgi:hypothetical protein